MLTRRSIVSFLTALPASLRAALATPQAASPAGRQSTAAPGGDSRSAAYRVWYTEPAANASGGLNIGNGHLGGTVLGGVDRERVALNEVRLYSGEQKDWNDPGAKLVLVEIRRLCLAGQFKEAEALCPKMGGPANEFYMPMGNLHLAFEHGASGGTASPGNYSRQIDLRSGTASVVYQSGGVDYKREYFVSFPDRVMVVHLTASKPGSLTLLAQLDSLLRYKTTADGSTTVMRGKCPKFVPASTSGDAPVDYSEDESGPGMIFECHMRSSAKGGKVWTDQAGIHAQGADEVTLLVTAATNYNGFDKLPSKEGRDPRPIARGALDAAAKKSHQALLAAHLKDYKQLFDRVELYLGKSRSGSDLPLDAGGRQSGRGASQQSAPDPRDPERLCLAFNYSRYRLIVASREGGNPVTVQGGFWNDQIRGPWGMSMHLNENTEKQYAQVEAANLSECAEPFIQLVEELAVNGSKTAQINYGCRGWVAHYRTDGWRQSATTGGKPEYTTWPMGGVWLCENLYNHYTFNGDVEYLRKRAYSVLKGAAEFCLDWLVEDPKSGYLVTAPATSPENGYQLPNGQICTVSMATACDMSLIWQLFKNTIEASRILGVDEAFREQVEKAQNRLYPLKIGSKGQILEWYEEYVEPETKEVRQGGAIQVEASMLYGTQHRHASHLAGLCWGTRITKRGTPELFAAARRSYELRRPTEGRGASLPERLGMAARLEDGELAYAQVRSGGLGGERELHMIEMLVQSHLKEIHLLPALPKEWPEGYLKGVKARGGYVLDIEWNKGKLAKSVIRSKFAGKCLVRTSVPVVVTAAGKPVKTASPEASVVEFDTRAGGVYEVTRKG